MRSNSNPAPAERGQAIVLLGLMVFGLIAIAGLAVDGGRLYAERRFAQNAADNAALAGALAICNAGDAVLAAKNAATANGDGAMVAVLVNQPPLSGPNAGDNAYVEVIVQSEKKPVFAQLVYSGDLEATARAVGRCSQTEGTVGGGNGLIALDPDDSRAIQATGSGCIRVNGGGIFDNSNHATQAFFADGGNTCGSNPRVSASWIHVVGGSSVPAWVNVNPAPTTGVAPMTDPLAGVPAPPRPSGSCVTANLGWAPSVQYLNPNVPYCSIIIGADARVVMNPGIYYIEGGQFRVEGAAQVTANGVMVYLTSGAVTITAGCGSVCPHSFTAPGSGAYKGMVFYLDRANTSTFTIDGGVFLTIRGTIYAPASSYVGAGSGFNATINAQVIAARFNVSGAAQLVINYDPDLVFAGMAGAGFIELAE